MILEAASLPAFLRLGSLPFFITPGLRIDGWGTWLATSPPADAVAAVLRLVAVGLTGWLLAGTALYLTGRLARLPGLVRAAGWATPRGLRRLVDAALTVAVTATVTGGTAFAAGPPAPPPPGVARVTATASLRPPLPRTKISSSTEVPAPTPAPTLPPAASGPPQEKSPAPAAPPGPHVVLPGESLWSIAAVTLAAGRTSAPSPPGPEQVARYWVDVVARNRPHLRSGNPNLIFPGEPVTLPPLP
ncbi:MAG TPA: hypothetical protein VFW71_00615 [Actinomycetota bacterium]|nr:hypothetical protein [Actinomycetota bacterium]